MNAETFYRLRVRDGRAVIRYRKSIDDFGEPNLRLWLCRVGRELVAVDDGDVDDEFLEAVRADESIDAIKARYKSHVSDLKARKKALKNTQTLAA